ncbi:c-type cytochrome biogenesis protein CcmI [Thetidibacter halocola]|uniref:C-type cytochrome biogenesis protein CcmI n=1 Tax=Thetidibacter halocola TaxID=2827239 RepID=A0A8J7WAU5_9RHOB|nr:c-type cytochrome biogenesis protein CcmI [Thetidibacter halocola]MBS0124132.1 c-type cytochrome biogenesis protein CcmI [Thetidibacter halocola]
MTLFWIMAGGMALAVSALLALALLRGRRETGPAEAFDLQVYRDQLKEIERDLARGTLPEDEAERLRTEVSRRLLSADARVQGSAASAGQPKTATLALAGAVVAVVLAGGIGLYMQIGAPGYPDLPLAGRIAAAADLRENRPSQAEAEAQMPETANPEIPEEYAQLVTRLRGAVAERPTDLRGQELLARSEGAMGNYRAAYAALEQVIALKGDAATSKDFADLADMMILAAGGYVSPEAQEALEVALERDPNNGVARYYGGLMMAQTGRPDIAFQMWDRLLRESPADAPWLDPIYEQMAEMAFRAGVSDYQLPDRGGPRGPTEADMANAATMTPEERMDMIRGMVGQLSDRLATEGGPPEDWSRLISSLMVLGEADQARAIWADAQQVFAEAPDALAVIRSTVERAGILD